MYDLKKNAKHTLMIYQKNEQCDQIIIYIYIYFEEANEKMNSQLI